MFFISLLKALVVLKIFKFYPDFLVIQENCLIKKLRLILKLMTSHTGKQMITIYILPNISRSNGSQKMKFGQLIENNMINNCIQRLCRKGKFQTSQFLKKLYIRSKQVVRTSFLIYIGRPLLGHALKTNCTTFQATDPEMCSILVFQKRIRDQLPHHILQYDVF